MVHVALVREDMLAHAICTVPVVSRPVVADHNRHHSLESEHAEVPFVQITDAITHAVYFRFSPSLHHQMAKELQAILAEIQEIQGGAGGSGDGGPCGPKGTSGSSKKLKKLTAEMDNWSHLLHSQVQSAEADVQNSPSRTQPLSLMGVQYGTKKVVLGNRTNPHVNWS